MIASARRAPFERSAIVESFAEEETPRGEAAKEDTATGGAGAGEREGKAESAPAPKAQARSARDTVTGQIDDLVATVRRLEAFAADEAKRVSGKLVPQIESKAKQNIWVSLLLALGLGLILGVWLTGGRRRD